VKAMHFYTARAYYNSFHRLHQNHIEFSIYFRHQKKRF